MTSVRPVLRLGDAGPHVSALQQSLAECGFACAGVELDPPAFGPETAGVVKYFQACNFGPDGRALVPDGVVGPRTWWALENCGSDHLSGASGALFDMPSQVASNPVARAALRSALEELRLGIRESPSGSNRGRRIDEYTGFSGRPPDVKGPPWCAYFASWNFEKAPGGSPFGRIGSSQSIVAYCQKNIPSSVVDVRDCFLAPAMSPMVTVKSGDLGVIPVGDVHGHIFQVAAVSGGTVWTVEGNSGNAVRSRKRAASSARWYLNFDKYARDRGL